MTPDQLDRLCRKLDKLASVLVIASAAIELLLAAILIVLLCK